MVQKDHKTIRTRRTSFLLSKKSKIIEIRLRSSENDGTETYQSHGGGSPQNGYIWHIRTSDGNSYITISSDFLSWECLYAGTDTNRVETNNSFNL